ncbi:hypothetical protein [Paenibacillus sp. NPDC057967]|uniref:hypothetical protein n=1 Tax=Paenibacillus sp. NPDC057967 TaxID=3346293 RepID=UPI0036D983A2
MKTYKQWALASIISILCILIAIASFNVLVDPYGIYHTPLKSYNNQKLGNKDPYLFKSNHFKRAQPDALVLGTSRAMRLNPPRIESLTGKTAYNLGLSSGSPYILLRYLEYAIKTDSQLESVYLGLDFETFNQSFKTHASFDEKRLFSPLYVPDYFNTLLTEKAIKDSFYVMRDNLNQTDIYTKSRFKDDGSVDESYIIPYESNITYLDAITIDYTLSLDSLEYVNQMKNICDQNGIQLILYISPVHAIFLETYWQLDHWPAYEEWKRRLVEIAPVWDFSGYHDISMSSLYQKEYYDDLSHFSKHTGDLMLYRMLNLKTDYVPDGFGVLITPSNVDNHLESIRNSRKTWPGKDANMQELILHY